MRHDDQVRPAIVLILPLLAGCLHEDEEPVLAPHVVVVTPPPTVVVVQAPAAPAEEAPASRRRLDHVVTLGERTYEPYTPRAAGPTQGQGTNVVINNNVTVNGGGGSGYYGGYYTPTYGTYGVGYEGGGRAAPRAAPTPALGTAAQSAPAQPGQTPGVGGNWPTIPSYGPRPMR